MRNLTGSVPNLPLKAAARQGSQCHFIGKETPIDDKYKDGNNSSLLFGTCWVPGIILRNLCGLARFISTPSLGDKY